METDAARGEEAGPAAFRLFHRLLAPFARTARRPAPDAPASVLLLHPGPLASVLLATPAVLALRRLWPQTRFRIALAPPASALYAGDELADATSEIAVDGLGALRAARRTLRARIREEKTDLVVNLDGLRPATALLAASLGRPAAGFAWPKARTAAYGTRVPFAPGRKGTELFRDLAEALGAPRDTAETHLVPPRLTSAEREQAAAALGAWGADPHALYVGLDISPGGHATGCGWPPEKYILLAESLERMGEYKTVFFGAPSQERFVTRHLRSMETKPINLSGRTSPRQFAALLTRMHCFVGNDSGPALLAAALGVPTVTIFGPESPVRLAPPEEEHHAVVRAEDSCGPCLRTLAGLPRPPCREGMRCVRDIPVERVRSVLEDLLDHLADPDEPPWMER